MDAGGLNWAILIGSHLVRPWVGWSQYNSLELETEIAGLRVEVFRARELVSGCIWVSQLDVRSGCETRSLLLFVDDFQSLRVDKGAVFIWAGK